MGKAVERVKIAPSQVTEGHCQITHSLFNVLPVLGDTASLHRLPHQLTIKQGKVYSTVSMLPFLSRGGNFTAQHEVVLC